MAAGDRVEDVVGERRGVQAAVQDDQLTYFQVGMKVGFWLERADRPADVGGRA